MTQLLDCDWPVGMAGVEVAGRSSLPSAPASITDTDANGPDPTTCTYINTISILVHVCILLSLSCVHVTATHRRHDCSSADGGADHSHVCGA